MSTYLMLFAIAILIVAMVMTLLKYSGRRERQSAPAARRGATSVRQRTRWRAVKIAPGLMACDAVQKLGDRVFLASESPHLPLGNCALGDCNCRYVHLDDRRSGGDRRIDLGSLGSYLPNNRSERRQRADRRAREVIA